mgnify:CR=1 FL=1
MQVMDQVVVLVQQDRRQQNQHDEAQPQVHRLLERHCMSRDVGRFENLQSLLAPLGIVTERGAKRIARFETRPGRWKPAVSWLEKM